MKYVKEVVFILAIPVSILFSGMAEAAISLVYPNRTLIDNSSGYCADVYRGDGRVFSDNKKNIYIKAGGEGFVPKNHPAFVKVDFYEKDNRDKYDSTSCHGKFYKHKHDLLNVSLLLADIPPEY
ncbi:hypothetical protein [Dickeya dadantii]|uniref:hypothetical protein n=1 Tax=Dickeya dadantii TaxID=204038 RepID=UPI00131F36FA|nr:hypothetical protein [Dickeya dadantii]